MSMFLRSAEEEDRSNRTLIPRGKQESRLCSGITAQQGGRERCECISFTLSVVVLCSIQLASDNNTNLKQNATKEISKSVGMNASRWIHVHKIRLKKLRKNVLCPLSSCQWNVERLLSVRQCKHAGDNRGLQPSKHWLWTAYWTLHLGS